MLSRPLSKFFSIARISVLGALLVAASVPAMAQPDDDAIEVWDTEPMAAERSMFVFSDWEGPDLPVWAYVPPTVDPKSAPIAFIMHGARRDPQRYVAEWVERADKGGFIIVAPEFSRKDFPRGAHYNRGALFVGEDGAISAEPEWSFSAIEPLFDMVVAHLGSNQKEYTLYGHSAGSQFVHRFLFLKPQARVKRYLPANAGWYSFPILDLDFPYGLGGVPVTEDALKAALAKDVVILLGDQDTDPDHSSLNRSKAAMRQGAHRFARGVNFVRAAAALAKERGWKFGWSVRVVPGVAHSNAGMAAGSYDLIE